LAGSGVTTGADPVCTGTTTGAAVGAGSPVGFATITVGVDALLLLLLLNKGRTPNPRMNTAPHQSMNIQAGSLSCAVNFWTTMLGSVSVVALPDGGGTWIAVAAPVVERAYGDPAGAGPSRDANGDVDGAGIVVCGGG